MPYIVQTELYTGGKCFTIVQILIASIRKFKLWSVLSKHMVQLIKHTMNAVNSAVFKKKTNKQKKKQSCARDHKKIPSGFAHLRLLKSQISFVTYLIFWERIGIFPVQYRLLIITCFSWPVLIRWPIMSHFFTLKINKFLTCSLCTRE